MAYCDPRQIARALAAFKPGMAGHDDPTWADDMETRPFNRGWSSGYTMGEDHGFGRGWEAAMSYRRGRGQRFKMMQRPGYRKLALRRYNLKSVAEALAARAALVTLADSP